MSTPESNASVHPRTISAVYRPARPDVPILVRTSDDHLWALGKGRTEWQQLPKIPGIEYAVPAPKPDPSDLLNAKRASVEAWTKARARFFGRALTPKEAFSDYIVWKQAHDADAPPIALRGFPDLLLEAAWTFNEAKKTWTKPS